MSLYGFGVSPWGTSQWGDAEVQIQMGYGKAYAVGDRVVRVELNIIPLHLASTGFGDALNPRTWRVRDPATNKLWTLMAVRQISDTVYEILTFEHLPKHFTELELWTADLLDKDYVPLPTLSFLFNGCYRAAVNTPGNANASAGYTQQDLQNALVPVSPADSAVYGEMASGTLKIDSAGDYTNQSGESFIKKLILRRLIAKPGDFFHLPRYGAGLAVKETLPVNNLRMLAAAIEAQVKLEPEVQAVKANLSYSASAAVLNVLLKVQLSPNGQIVQFPLVVPTGSVQ